MRISDWSSDVCSSDLRLLHLFNRLAYGAAVTGDRFLIMRFGSLDIGCPRTAIKDRQRQLYRADRPGIEIGIDALRMKACNANRTTQAQSGITLCFCITDFGDRKSTRLNSSH